MIRRHVIVHGQVQGVGFRYSAREQAIRRDVTGYVRNQADDSVEVDIEGSEAAVASMLEWLKAGPWGAEVSSLTVTELEPTGHSGFDIRY
ncbi:acylphosphatase [Leifsonia sp. A12D58]|uniref:acylphosphatase n=1 Tax=Leifsonia sp. A12D58 TaxID=3397674 RepID=UPI0039E1EC84